MLWIWFCCNEIQMIRKTRDSAFQETFHNYKWVTAFISNAAARGCLVLSRKREKICPFLFLLLFLTSFNVFGERDGESRGANRFLVSRFHLADNRKFWSTLAARLCNMTYPVSCWWIAMKCGSDVRVPHRMSCDRPHKAASVAGDSHCGSFL